MQKTLLLILLLIPSFLLNIAYSQGIFKKNSVSVYSGMGFFVDTKQESIYSSAETFNNSVGYIFGGEYSYYVNNNFAVDLSLSYMGTKSDKILGITSEINSFNFYVSPRFVIPVGNIVKFGLSAGLGYSSLTDKIIDDNIFNPSNPISVSSTDNRAIIVPAFSFAIPVSPNLDVSGALNATIPLNESESAYTINGVENKFKRNIITIGTIIKLSYNF